MLLFDILKYIIIQVLGVIKRSKDINYLNKKLYFTAYKVVLLRTLILRPVILSVCYKIKPKWLKDRGAEDVYTQVLFLRKSTLKTIEIVTWSKILKLLELLIKICICLFQKLKTNMKNVKIPNDHYTIRKRSFSFITNGSWHMSKKFCRFCLNRLILEPNLI